MKLTKSQLKQIIKEELLKELRISEGQEWWVDEMKKVMTNAHQIQQRLKRAGKTEELAAFKDFFKRNIDMLLKHWSAPESEDFSGEEI